METSTAEPASQNPQQPPTLAKQPRSISKFIYLGIFLLILLALGIGGFWFLNRNSATETNNSGQNIATSEANENEEEEEEFEKGYVIAEAGLNLRSEATTDSAIILLLPFGTEMDIISTQGDWYFIEAQTKGFVAKEFVSSDKPSSTLKVFKEEKSPFNFLYPSVYQIKFTPAENSFEYSFTGNDSFGGFKVETETGLVTLGNYSLKNYASYTKSACDVKFAANRKECEKLVGEAGTIYLVLIDTTLYKFSYLKTEGGLLEDMKNLVFFSLYFKQ